MQREDVQQQPESRLITQAAEMVRLSVLDEYTPWFRITTARAIAAKVLETRDKRQVGKEVSAVVQACGYWSAWNQKSLAVYHIPPASADIIINDLINCAGQKGLTSRLTMPRNYLFDKAKLRLSQLALSWAQSWISFWVSAVLNAKYLEFEQTKFIY